MLTSFPGSSPRDFGQEGEEVYLEKLIAHWKEILSCNTYPVEIREIANSVMVTLKIDYYNDQSRIIAYHATLVIF